MGLSGSLTLEIVKRLGLLMGDLIDFGTALPYFADCGKGGGGGGGGD